MNNFTKMRSVKQNHAKKKLQRKTWEIRHLLAIDHQLHYVIIIENNYRLHHFIDNVGAQFLLW